MNAPASCAILGLGYLGRPLAETLWQHGSRVFAWKKTVTSDDVNLPIDLASGDIAYFLANGFQTAFAFWQERKPGSACCRRRPARMRAKTPMPTRSAPGRRPPRNTARNT